MEEFETVMQTRDEVEGLHDCQEFSQPLECLYQAMQTQDKSFQLLLLNKMSASAKKKVAQQVCKDFPSFTRRGNG